MSDQVDRQIQETAQGGRRHGKLRLRRRPSQPRERQRGVPLPGGRPVDRPLPTPDPSDGGKGILDDFDRSDRESGRPVQLGEGESGETASGHQPEAGGNAGEAVKP